MCGGLNGMDLLGIALAIVFAQWLHLKISYPRRGRDSTDPEGGRSGLMIWTDALTGLQYLATPLGGLTPRLDSNGRHMRETEVNQ